MVQKFIYSWFLNFGFKISCLCICPSCCKNTYIMLDCHIVGQSNMRRGFCRALCFYTHYFWLNIACYVIVNTPTNPIWFGNPSVAMVTCLLLMRIQFLPSSSSVQQNIPYTMYIISFSSFYWQRSLLLPKITTFNVTVHHRTTTIQRFDSTTLPQYTTTTVQHYHWTTLRLHTRCLWPAFLKTRSNVRFIFGIPLHFNKVK